MARSVKMAARAGFTAAVEWRDCRARSVSVLLTLWTLVNRPTYYKDVTGSQSQLCDRRLETGSGSLSWDSGTKLAPVARFESSDDQLTMLTSADNIVGDVIRVC